MRIEDRRNHTALSQQLSAAKVEFCSAQLKLETLIQLYGLSSPEAKEAFQRCSALAFRFSRLETEFLTQTPCPEA